MTQYGDSPLDGYFAPAVVAQPSATAWPPAGGGRTVPPQAPPASRAVHEPPVWVAAVATVLVLTGVAAAWTGLTVVVALRAVHAVTQEEGALLRAFLLLANAALNGALAFQLLRGSGTARVLATAVSGFWLLYWLWRCTQVSTLGSALRSASLPVELGGIGTMLTLGVLLLCSLAGASAALLWTPSAGGHFSGR